MFPTDFIPARALVRVARRLTALLLLVGLLPPGLAAAGAASDSPAAMDAAALRAVATASDDAVRMREEMATGIVGGREKGNSALARLKAHPAPMGMGKTRDSQFALAAIDMGLRLIGPGKLDEAALFFQEAERTLVRLSNRTPDSSAQEKAQYLNALAMIRSRFLNNPVQGKADLEAAQALQPDNEDLIRIRRASRPDCGISEGNQPPKK